MSKTTTMSVPAGRAQFDAGHHDGLFHRVYAALIAGQQARADRFLKPYLAQASVADLAALGFTATEIAEIKRNRDLPVTGWI